jgi:iron complex outermembrane receptor protein
MEYAPLWLVDSRINWNRNLVTLYLEVNNLLNTTYFDYGNVEQPGIWGKAGVVLKIRL